MEVTWPILSVSYLCEDGTETHLVRQPFLKYGDRREPLIEKSGVYFVKAQIVHEVKGAVGSCVRAGDSQNSCVRAEDSQNSCVRVEGLHNSQNSCVQARDSEKSCVRAQDSQDSQKPCVRVGDSQNSCVRVEGLQNSQNPCGSSKRNDAVKFRA